MSPGDTKKFLCDFCGKEFEITLEPYAPDASDATPELCPFCGTLIEEGDA